MENVSHVQKKDSVRKKILFGQILVTEGLLSSDALQRALHEQKLSGKLLGEILLDLRLISDTTLSRNLAGQWGFDFMDLRAVPIDPRAVLALDESVARQNHTMPIVVQDRILTIAMADPMNYEAVQNICFSTGLKVVPAMATYTDIMEAINKHYLQVSNVQSIVEETQLNGETEKIDQILPEMAEITNTGRSLEEQSQMAPVIRLVNIIISRAVRMRASDIHIEPGRSDLCIRFRIDGLLKEVLRMTHKMLPSLVSRIKVMARLDIAERRIPQDGAIRFDLDHQELDLRISMLPTCYGEKVVIRILNKAKDTASLDHLGWGSADLARLNRLLEKKQGILLITGPTGSGKTTTLYAMIKALSDQTRSIVTVEDPIEYNIDGINQVQVKSSIGLTFASCLRAILRQDPNIILIGEIRDLETAEIAMRASMTGHFVLSTLHTNDAPSAVTRLVDLGVPRYLVASGIIGVVAQRLVREICHRCKIKVSENSETSVRRDMLQRLTISGTVFRGAGCSYCDGIGYFGRIGLFEVMEMTPSISVAVGRGSFERELRDLAMTEGLRTLLGDGIDKVKQGLITPEELLRVVELD